MARGATAAVLAGGLLQGVALVSVPAASAELTGRSGFGLSATAYGLVFLPQVLAAIGTSLGGGALGRRFGVKALLLAGLALDAIAMAVLAASRLLEHAAAAYPVLLVATAALGAGFGLAVPALNTVTAGLHPKSAATAGLVLNALLGLGTALAPVFVAVFTGLGAWWLLPVVVAVALVVLLPLAAATVPASRAQGAPGARGRTRLSGFALLAAAALLYGVAETMSGNWSGSVLREGVGAPAALASAALAVFWAAVTAGRIALAGLERVVPPAQVLRFTPVPIAIAYAGVALLPHGAVAGAIVAFALAGLGCAAMLPQLETLAQQRFPHAAGAAASRTVAFYQAGYGVAAFGVGPLTSLGVPLSALFGATAVLAVLLAICTGLLTEHRPDDAATAPPQGEAGGPPRS